MASLRGLGWPEDTGLRVPVRAPAGDPVAGLGALARGPAAGGWSAPTGAMHSSAGVAPAPGPGPVAGAPGSVRRSGSLGWPLTPDVSRETIPKHDARSARGEQPVGGEPPAPGARRAAREQAAGDHQAEQSRPG